MEKDDDQRIEMRDRIIAAAIETYAELGFQGASTRAIAKRADTSQGLLTYHFKNKNVLWKEAVDRMFENIREEFGEEPFSVMKDGSHQDAVLNVKKFLRYNAEKPHLLKFIIEGGKEKNERSEYMIENHVRPFFDSFKKQLPGAMQGDMAAHVMYAWIGASMTLFTVPAEFKSLTGVDPRSEEAIERQAELIAHLFLPGNAMSMIVKAMQGGLASFKSK